MNQIDLKNKVAVVTGGAQGIGMAIAERLLASGSSVCLWDRDEKLVRNTLNETESRSNFINIIQNLKAKYEICFG